MKKKVCIQTEIPITIFEEPIIKKEVDKLFTNIEYEFCIRVTEVLSTIREKPIGILSYENLLSIFKINFYEILLDKAIINTLNGNKDYNLKENILDLLKMADGKLKEYIYSEILINTISEALYSIPVKNTLESCIYRSKVAILYDKYVQEDDIYS